MIVKQYIKDFENLGFGLFVHYGLYSCLGSGEWTKRNNQVPDEQYNALPSQFLPDRDWAKNLAAMAKRAGCRYITLTCRHHDGFSLYDTKGLSTFDAPHSLCGRDLVVEFCSACREAGLMPFFYHTLIDWHEKSCETDFKAYLRYLRKSVELLCKHYGKIGGFWFDGMWAKPEEDWEEDALYGLIRQYQPEAMIINNTGMEARGKLGHIELDSVTFERGKPLPINLEDSPKYIASEMCEVLCDHWGYAKEDFHYKSPALLIEELAECRKFGSNFLLNVGPMGNGEVDAMDQAYFALLGNWMNLFGEAIYTPKPVAISIERKKKDFLLKKDDVYYLFCFDLPMVSDSNVALFTEGDYQDEFHFSQQVKEIHWMDNGQPLSFTQCGDLVTVQTEPYEYGRNLVVRVAVIRCAE